MSQAQITRLFMSNKLSYDKALRYLMLLGLDNGQARTILELVEQFRSPLSGGKTGIRIATF